MRYAGCIILILSLPGMFGLPFHDARAEGATCEPREGLIQLQIRTVFSFQSDVYNVKSIHRSAAPRVDYQSVYGALLPDTYPDLETVAEFDPVNGITRTLHCITLRRVLLPREHRPLIRTDLDLESPAFQLGVGPESYELNLPQLRDDYRRLAELSDEELAAGLHVIAVSDTIDLTGFADPDWLIPLEARISDREDGTQSMRVKLFNPTAVKIRDIGLALELYRNGDTDTCSNMPGIIKGQIALGRNEDGTVSGSATELSFDELVPVDVRYAFSGCDGKLMLLEAQLGDLPPVDPGTDLYLSYVLDARELNEQGLHADLVRTLEYLDVRFSGRKIWPPFLSLK